MRRMEEQRCRWHRRRPAQATCVSCSSRVCKECTVHTRVGVKCRSCAGVVVGMPWRRVAAVVGSVLAACAIAVLVVVLVVGSHGSDTGGTLDHATPPPPTATPVVTYVSTPIPCDEQHLMC